MASKSKRASTRSTRESVIHVDTSSQQDDRFFVFQYKAESYFEGYKLQFF